MFVADPEETQYTLFSFRADSQTILSTLLTLLRQKVFGFTVRSAQLAPGIAELECNGEGATSSAVPRPRLPAAAGSRGYFPDYSGGARAAPGRAEGSRRVRAPIPLCLGHPCEAPRQPLLFLYLGNLTGEKKVVKSIE